MNALPRTDIQRRLDDDFEALFPRSLPPIACAAAPIRKLPVETA